MEDNSKGLCFRYADYDRGTCDSVYTVGGPKRTQLRDGEARQVFVVLGYKYNKCVKYKNAINSYFYSGYLHHLPLAQSIAKFPFPYYFLHL